MLGPVPYLLLFIQVHDKSFPCSMTGPCVLDKLKGLPVNNILGLTGELDHMAFAGVVPGFARVDTNGQFMLVGKIANPSFLGRG